MGGQHGHLADNERQFAVGAGSKFKDHLAFTSNFHALHLFVIGAVDGRGLLYECCERKSHILSCNRGSVRKLGLRAQAHSQGCAVWREVKAFGQQPAHDELLRAALAYAKSFVGQAKLCRADAARAKGIEAVECANGALAEPSALGRVRVYLGKWRERFTLLRILPQAQNLTGRAQGGRNCYGGQQCRAHASLERSHNTAQLPVRRVIHGWMTWGGGCRYRFSMHDVLAPDALECVFYAKVKLAAQSVGALR